MKQLTPYNLGNKNDLVHFDLDCFNAASECPQCNYDHHYADILNNNMKGEDIFRIWNNCEELWTYGYDEDLSTMAQDTFEYVREYGNQGLRTLCEKK